MQNLMNVTDLSKEKIAGLITTAEDIIANPDKVLYQKLGLNPAVDYSQSAIGIVTVSPAETAIILGDISIKSSGVDLGFVDRFSGTLIVTGTVSQVEAALDALIKYSSEVLGVSCCAITKT